MDQPKPAFREPEYGNEGLPEESNAEATVERVVTDTSKPAQPPFAKDHEDASRVHFKGSSSAGHAQERASSTHTKDDEDKSDRVEAMQTPPSHDENGTSGHHLTFTKSAKNAAGEVSRKLHLHRGEGKGPSEARERRQSTFVEAPVHLPWYIHLRNAVYGSLIMFTTFPYWDMAFWSGSSYTWGSILFVIDGAWAWTPLRWPESEFHGEETGVGLLFFIGALFYQVGATMAYLEAINDGSFGGRAMKRHLEGHDEDAKRLMDDKLHIFFGHMIPHHHHDDEDKDVDLEKQKSPMQNAPRRGGVDAGEKEKDQFHEYLTWRWWPTWHAFKTYHIREMGYVACSIQLFGATLYGICGVISLPGILDKFEPWQSLGGYWVPQTVASVCFLTAGIMFTLITQEKWYKPLPGRIAWWIGVWATIGSIGFLLSATFGLKSEEYTWCAYQSSLSSMWGSFAYLTSSWLQWYESVNKGPVLAFPNNRIPTVMREAKS